ncbi:pseudaminic acid cytidylyltransferase [Serratia fonticola]|uniref:pseudaminic acid cytidylyltransferase n=1 Tax=Serratia fonticola TaxID=47917 RepID=UPI00217864DC|nr:pseudaminic acid cytidylyltransferase [Serratia fonticola]MDK2375907.1 pseudaminic acid cytidylyltransferase [Serratia fonticola]CAI1560850.1 N-acylneuraminate cytidylyltransferase [Serratia fonticola]CAI1637511.1 N-acylneuraminate cytidylyltransferase [Serratia fonticola]CAI1674922.1 N-acylneuraminate cytidylyltransferase [Serratia fonticola]
MKIAIIPARGGSKRIPRKNIKEFCGKPMIAYSIEAALESGLFERIIVSTDDDEIAGVANEYGAEAPFVRPEHLSNDHCGTVPVIKHAAEWLISQGEKPESICCIYATAPFLNKEDLVLGYERLCTTECDYAFSATSFPYPIQRALSIDSDMRVSMFNPELFYVRSQELCEAWHDAGQFYWGTCDAWINEKPVFNSDARAVLLPRHRVQDIDTMEDWTLAEWSYKTIILQGD